MTKKPLLVLFDGNNLVHRAYHALPPLTVRKTGEVVNAVYGFILMLLKSLEELKPTHYAIAFDMKAPTFRHHLYEEYKAQRPPTPEDLSRQLERVRGVAETFRLPIFELEGYEADDVLGTLSQQARRQDMETVIVTGDADTMQLVAPGVKVYYPKRSFSDTALYDEAAVIERYGVKPEYIPDLKALVGDPSDNIPGVKGIGEKTAVKLIQQFGPLEEIYAHINQVTPLRVQVLLRENEAAARQSKELALIVKEVPVTLSLEECQVRQYDRAKLAELLRELEFYSLIPRIPEGEARTPALVETQAKYQTVASTADLEVLLSKIPPAIALDVITTGPDPMTAQIVGIALATAPGEACYIPIGHMGLGEPNLPLAEATKRLKPILEDPRYAKVAHDGNYRLAVLAENGVNLANLSFDTMLAAHLLGEKSLTLTALAFGRLGVEMTPLSALAGTGAKQIPIYQVPVEKVAPYAGANADMVLRLARLLEEELRRENLWSLFTEVEMPLVPVLVRMERNGVLLDTGLLGQMSKELGEQLQKLEREIYRSIGHEFNVNSPQQLSAVLFKELNLPTPHKARQSTEAAVLEELRGAHPVIGLVLEYRQLAKLKSTYVDALPSLINPRTGRLHTSFNQTRTATGRLSSSEPNLQNIPVRGELGRRIRQAFIAPPGSRLLAGDYSQIDLRALAHLSQDAGLLEAFRKDEDIHRATAAQLFGVAPSEVTPEMRRVAKTVNFGVIYGISEYGLEQATELSREEAGRFITAYFGKYPGVKAYLEGTREQARKMGYVQTLLGRRRSIPEVNSPNRMVREAAERMAINMPVQGTSADIIKVAMLKLHREMETRNLASKMLLQVHDELIFEVPELELMEMRSLVQDIMSSAIELSVPVKVDLKTGTNWGEME